MNNNISRHIYDNFLTALSDTPAVILHGPRQCGKTTLAKMLAEAEGYAYFTLDDADTRRYAATDPAGFVNHLPKKSVLDEVQFAPDLFPSIKLAIDRNQRPGQFILTGSVDLLRAPRIKESLAGRTDIIHLHPFSQSEIEGNAPRFLDALFSPAFVAAQNPPADPRIIERVASGGYPQAFRRTPTRRANWYHNYLEALLRHDVPTLSNIRSPQMLPRILALAATQTAQLLNVSAIGAPLEVQRLTSDNYLALLENMFLLERLPAWHNTRKKRLLKRPKVHLRDSGLACALLNVHEGNLPADRNLFGNLLETFVFQEMKRQAGAHTVAHQFYHFREKSGGEVDIVVERGPMCVAGVEVKSGGTVSKSDFRGLLRLQQCTGDSFVGGVVLYTGHNVVVFGERLYALPVHYLWK